MNPRIAYISVEHASIAVTNDNGPLLMCAIRNRALSSNCRLHRLTYPPYVIAFAFVYVIIPVATASKQHIPDIDRSLQIYIHYFEMKIAWNKIVQTIERMYIHILTCTSLAHNEL